MVLITRVRRKRSNNMEVHSTFDHEICQMLFSLFQKLLYFDEQNSELHNMVEMLHLNLRDYISSKGVTSGLTCYEAPTSQLWTLLKELFDSSDDIMHWYAIKIDSFVNLFTIPIGMWKVFITHSKSYESKFNSCLSVRLPAALMPSLCQHEAK